MIVEAEQHFTLVHPGPPEAALAFVRDPRRSLSRATFLRGLRHEGGCLSGELLVPLPVLGEVDLPFVSALHPTPAGARLEPRPLSGERAWVEVAGEAALGGQDLQFHFTFRAHLRLPEEEGWGAAAFGKMVQAAAARTLDRLARELPGRIREALEAQGEA